VTGTPEEPCKAGISVADIAAGMYAYSGILTALYTRATTGSARAVEVPIFEALGEWLSQPAFYTRYGGAQPPRIGTQHATIAPYGAYTAADGGQVLLSVQNEREWAALCERFLERPKLVNDPRFATGPARVAHRDELNAIIVERFRRSSSAEVRETLDGAGIANSEVNDIQEFVAHPVLAERGRWHDVGIPGAEMRALQPPADLAGIVPRMDPVPAAGEHTERILTELGRTATEIDGLRAEGAI
jgi:itaconate CoA-transferase